jgi:hypothetical protein
MPSGARPGTGKTRSALSLQRMGTGVEQNCRKFSSVDRSPAAFSRRILYSPFTAAVGKIPLSMVQVKFKPQYLVFSMYSLVTDHKTLDFCCGKLSEASLARGLMSMLLQKWCKSSPATNPEKTNPGKRTRTGSPRSNIPQPSPAHALATRRKTGAFSGSFCACCG